MNEALKFLKSTLRLPGSKFPPRPPPQALTQYISRCDGLYSWQKNARPAGEHKIFTLHDGPPYANGDLHVGHALNKITKDIICRSKLAEGYGVNYTPGWDCHGLPIELKALEKNGWGRGQGIDPVKIRGAARGFASKTIEKQMKGFRSWGIMADWDNRWTTMDKEFELRQLAVFKAMADYGLIIRRHKPVYWSPSSRTALAEAEIERDWHNSTAALVKFRIPATVGGSEEPVYAVVWTTTPWTLPANQAVAINQDIQYLLVRSKKHGNLVVAAASTDFLYEKLAEDVQVLKVLDTADLLNCTYSGIAQFGADALNRPIVHADFVTEGDGTGLVHCAPGHGQEDYAALQEHIESGRILVKAPVDDLGQFTDAACPTQPSLLAGKYVFKEGNQAVLELLRSENALITSYNFKHKYPIDWRTKQPIMIRATAQWFADISKIKEDVLDALEGVTFRPESGKARLRSFVENRTEWCISRQRAWGVPIPALYHKQTNEAVLNSHSINHIIETIKERGINAWWSDPPDEPAWIMPGLSPADYLRGTDTMDVWFDSGTSWALMTQELGGQAIVSDPLANVYLEGSDQHRGWFQSSILTRIAYERAVGNPTPTAPFKELITHGFTLDAEGKKMSKSLGNVIAPDQIIAGLAHPPQPKKGRVVHPHGPDALRLWAATGDWTSDVTISEKVVSNVHKSLDKYRVTMKVLLGMLFDFDPKEMISYAEMEKLPFEQHRLALFHLYRVVTSVKLFMQNYEFHKALASINEWLAKDLSGFYLELVKDSIYCDGTSAIRRKVGQTVLYHIFSEFQQMLGPITPLLIEETHDFTPQAIKEFAGHPFHRVWEPAPEDWNNGAIADSLAPRIDHINTVVKIAQEKARADKLLGQSLACEVDICSPNNEPMIRNSNWEDLLVVSHVRQAPADPQIVSMFKEAKEDVEVLRAAAARHVNQQEHLEWSFVQEVGDGSGGYVVVRPPTEEKCARCWRYAAPKPKDEETPALCSRCDEVVAEIKSSATKPQG